MEGDMNLADLNKVATAMVAARLGLTQRQTRWPARNVARRATTMGLRSAERTEKKTIGGPVECRDGLPIQALGNACQEN